MTSGSTPTNEKDTRRIRTGRPSSRAVSSSASRAAVAPSLMPAALPAVTLPWERNGVLRPASVSMVVSGRIGSSLVARPQPASADRVATGTRSRCRVPASYAALVFCWERTA